METLPVLLSIGIDESKSEELDSLIANYLVKSDFHVSYNKDIVKKIDNVYYSANIRLKSSNNRNIKTDVFKNVEVIFFYIDHKVEDPLPELCEWITKLNWNNVETKMLIYKEDIQQDINETVQQWCVKNECEVVRLQSSKEKFEEDCDIDEKIGIDRIIEVLHAHQWSNLIIKKKQKNIVEDTENNSTDSSSEVNVTPSGDSCDNFENLSVLFQNLMAMKANLASLSPLERAEQAGRIAETFLHAVGGDEEISDPDEVT